eukprot:m51a1_g6267 hypothetical protein (184) ;mRNA; f:140188-141009
MDALAAYGSDDEGSPAPAAQPTPAPPAQPKPKEAAAAPAPAAEHRKPPVDGGLDLDDLLGRGPSEVPKFLRAAEHQPDTGLRNALDEEAIQQERDARKQEAQRRDAARAKREREERAAEEERRSKIARMYTEVEQHKAEKKERVRKGQPLSFNEKEKRKRDNGQCDRSKNFVEEEKRILRGSN